MKSSVKIQYLSILNYTPRGDKNNTEIKSRKLRNAIKNWQNPEQLTSFLHKILNSDSNIQAFFGDRSSLVPIPGSTLIQPGTLRNTLEICSTLISNYPTLQLADCLQRYKPIRSSSSGFSSEERPSIQQHIDTIRCNNLLINSEQIILVDDIITMGRTSCACYQILTTHFPEKKIKVFALLRPVEILSTIPYTNLGEIIFYNEAFTCFTQK